MPARLVECLQQWVCLWTIPFQATEIFQIFYHNKKKKVTSNSNSQHSVLTLASGSWSTSRALFPGRCLQCLRTTQAEQHPHPTVFFKSLVRKSLKPYNIQMLPWISNPSLVKIDQNQNKKDQNKGLEYISTPSTELSTPPSFPPSPGQGSATREKTFPSGTSAKPWSLIRCSYRHPQPPATVNREGRQKGVLNVTRRTKAWKVASTSHSWLVHLSEVQHATWLAVGQCCHIEVSFVLS